MDTVSTDFRNGCRYRTFKKVEDYDWLMNYDEQQD